MKEKQQQESFKTEEQLKAEARERREAEERLAAAEPKSERRKQLENFWYHNKWRVLAGAVLVLLLVSYMRDFFKPRPDITLVMISGSYIADETITAMADMLEPIAGDFNEDEVNLIEVNAMMIPGANGSDSQLDYANTMKIAAVVAANADPIFLLDAAALQYLTGMGGEDASAEALFAQASAPMPAEIAAVFPELAELRFYLRDKEGLSKTDYFYWCEELLLSMRAE